MKSTLAFSMLLLVLAPSFLFAAPPSLAVGDFTVLSDNPRLKYVGKGLAEMVAAEIASSRSVILVDRSRRAELLGEMEFSLGDAADPAVLVRFGKLLAADLLLFGEIIDMDTAVLVSCSLVKVESGEVIWADKILGPLSDYNGISRKLAASALKGLGHSAAAVAAVPRKEPRATEAKKEEAIIAFSDAVDAVDRKDETLARRKIREAQAIDPGNAAVVYFVALLESGSPRLRVELDYYAPTYNPALSAFLDKGLVYQWVSKSSLVGSDVASNSWIILPTVNSGLKFKEEGTATRTGILHPLGARSGLSAEVTLGFVNGYFGNESHTPVVVESLESEINTVRTIYGAGLGLGIAPTPRWSIGISGTVSLMPRWTDEVVDTWSDVYPGAAGMHFGVSAGVAYRGPGGVLNADALVVWSNQPEFYLESPPDGVDADSAGNLWQVPVPLILSAGISAGFLDNRLLPNLRVIGEVGRDERGYFSVRTIPGVEWRPFRRLALRGAYEFVFVTAEEGSILGGPADATGSGFMGGGTVTVGKLELSVNAIYRFRPFRLLPGSGHPDFTWMMGVAWNGLGSRK